MSPRRLELVRLGPLPSDPGLPRWLAGQLQRRLGLDVRPGEPVPLSDDWRDDARRQYDSSRIVDSLIGRDDADPARPERWLLAVTEADLFAADRDFVFGEATQGGRWAVISLARLRPDASALAPAALLRRRALKEAIHEIGHLAGLEHCHRPGCVMFASPGILATDAKSTAFCPACRGALGRGAGLDPPPSQR